MVTINIQDESVSEAFDEVPYPHDVDPNTPEGKIKFQAYYYALIYKHLSFLLFDAGDAVKQLQSAIERYHQIPLDLQQKAQINARETWWREYVARLEEQHEKVVTQKDNEIATLTARIQGESPWANKVVRIPTKQPPRFEPSSVVGDFEEVFDLQDCSPEFTAGVRSAVNGIAVLLSEYKPKLMDELIAEAERQWHENRKERELERKELKKLRGSVPPTGKKPNNNNSH